MPSFAPPYLRQNATMRSSASSFSSDHRPRSFLLSRPGISTAVASVMSSAAPDTDRWPRCIMCQSVALPFSAEYWPIGETTMRLPSSSPRILYLEKRMDDMLPLGSRSARRYRRTAQAILWIQFRLSPDESSAGGAEARRQQFDVYDSRPSMKVASARPGRIR